MLMWNRWISEDSKWKQNIFWLEKLLQDVTFFCRVITSIYADLITWATENEWHSLKYNLKPFWIHKTFFKQIRLNYLN